MGVFPGLLSAPWLSTGLPHVRGGVSQTGWADIDSLLSSPRAWGCFHFCVGACYHLQVFPTCVGVFLAPPARMPFKMCLPHVRGGVSPVRIEGDPDLRSSPRAWGCFFRRYASGQYTAVFPTCVGVFLQTVIKLVLAAVFPTCVGVFLILVWCS